MNNRIVCGHGCVVSVLLCRIGLIALGMAFVMHSVSCNAQDWGGSESDGSVFVEYEVREGYKVKVKIKDEYGKVLFEKLYISDVYSIEVEFIDLIDGVGSKDLLIKLSDESGYTPLVFLDYGGGVREVFDGVSYPLYVNSEREIDEDGGIITKPSYSLSDSSIKGKKALKFNDIYVRESHYSEIVFELLDNNEKLTPRLGD